MAKNGTGRNRKDLRLIEAGFPCHQVGAETQRERGASSALPPLYYLHVWWARRPLTPSRAAILGSLLPAETDPDWFLRQLGIEKTVAIVGTDEWVLEGELLNKVETDQENSLFMIADNVVISAFQKENDSRCEQRTMIESFIDANHVLYEHPALLRWRELSKPISKDIYLGQKLSIKHLAADPAWFNEIMGLGKISNIRVPNMYGYSRAYNKNPEYFMSDKVVLDPTAGGGSIPLEALRSGSRVIANDINPVAAVILYATLDYPARFGFGFLKDIERYGNQVLMNVDKAIRRVFNLESILCSAEARQLMIHVRKSDGLFNDFNREEVTTYLYTRQVICPHCGGEAPLLNTCWLSKEGNKWGVSIITDGQKRNGTVKFETYRMQGSRGPNGEDPNQATVTRGVGQCVHCRQAIDADEIKAQARGESAYGKWKDRLYAVVAIRYQPKLDKNGQVQRYKTGERKGEIKTEKIRFFRPPNEKDLDALEQAEQQLASKWPAWEAANLIPTENFPDGNDMRPVLYGMPRWCDMFTPRQLLGHMTMIDELNKLKPAIIKECGFDRGRAIITYLQFMIDKGIDYNSKQTRWIPQRATVSGTFGRHDFSLKWTFGEMVFSGPNSGAAWGLSQIMDAYTGIAELVNPLHQQLNGTAPPVSISCGTAANIDIPPKSVDLICMDPPYYNNVQYAELSDYFYVWHKRTLADLYPGIYTRRLTNKNDEAVANPARDGSSAGAAGEYERLMGEIFTECRRVLNDDGIMTVMFTHKTQAAWEALTRSLMENNWIITSAMPVESEFANSQHLMNSASAASSIFISCRKRISEELTVPATWTGIGGRGVVEQVRQGVRKGLEDFAILKLNPVDEMVASYGRALQVLSEHWPVMDGDELVSPSRAMNEASAIVAQHQITKISNGRLSVGKLKPEAAMALTMYGIFGLADFAYDDALSLSKSLNIRLENRPAGYQVEPAMIGINPASPASRSRSSSTETASYHAPLVKSGSKLRLAQPEERSSLRLNNPQTEWDILHGIIMAYRSGDILAVRPYLQRHAATREEMLTDILRVWATEMPDDELRKEAEAILYGLK